MGKYYNVDDYQIGDSVYHLSNTNISMVVIDFNKNPDEITCRWMDKNGVTHEESFLPQELGQTSDLGSGFAFL